MLGGGILESRDELIRLRKAQGFTQREVAEALGITTSYFGMIELGKRTPNLEIAKKIAEFFGEPLEHLFFNQENNKMLFSDRDATLERTG